MVQSLLYELCARPRRPIIFKDSKPKGPTEMFDIIFAPKGEYPPCGIFSAAHIITASALILLVAVLLYFSRGMSEKNAVKITKAVFLTVAVLESVKIIYCLSSGQTAFDSFVPLHYCSLLIYSSGFAGFGRGFIRECGRSFLTGASVIGGMAFLIYPSTSITMFPIYHFQSMYSMLFHSLMIYLGMLYLINGYFSLSVENYKYYMAFFIPFATAAMLMNAVFGCNLMFLREPYNIPVPFLSELRDFSQFLYTALILFLYSLLPYFIPKFVKDLFLRISENKSEKVQADK